MKSGENGLIGPGDNDYGRVVKELTPELADKIFKSVQKQMYDERVSKDMVLHHLKQLKAQMGKFKSKNWLKNLYTAETAIDRCMEMIDNKITKINSKP